MGAAQSPFITRVDPTTDADWESLTLKYDSDVFHSPRWLRVLRDAYGFEPRATLLSGADGASAGFVHCEVDGVAGRRIVSLPFSDFCDPLVATVDDWTAIVDAEADCGYPLIVRTRANGVPHSDSGFVETGRARWHGLDLTPGRDHLWLKMHESARRAVRKAAKSGVTVQQASSESDLRAFYDMHLGTRKHKYRLLAQPYGFFQRIWDEFLSNQEDGALLLASVDGVVIGGALFLVWKDRLYYKFNASRAGSLAVRPNDLVIWTAVEFALDRGLRRLDFGLTDWEQESLARYKRKFGADEGVLRTVRYGKPAPTAPWAVEALSRLTDLLTDPKTPDHVTEQAAFLYRHFA